jgi:hypothetical protein
MAPAELAELKEQLRELSPLRSRSRVDLGEFFGKQGCHRLSPTSDLSMSICHDLYFVYKAASVRFDLLQAWYKLVIIS